MLALTAGATPAAQASRAPYAPARTKLDAAGLPPLADQMRYRAELGLPADATVVSDLNARWASGELAHATVEGAVFTADEEAELDAREAAAREIQHAARAYFKGARAGVFGGVYIDQETGKTVVMVTRDAAEHAAALRARTNHGDRLTTRVVAFGLSDLTRVADALIATSGVSYAHADELANHITIGLAQDSPAARSALLASLAAADAKMVRFITAPKVEETGVNALNAPPLKGGQRITQPFSNGQAMVHTCTSAFIAYANVRTDAAIYVTTYYMMTAGHCDDSQGLWSQYQTYPIGRMDRTAFYSGGSDAMRIPINPADRSQYVAITATNDRHIYYRQANTEDVLTERVCMSGATTGGERCGTLMSKAISYTKNGMTFSGLRQATFQSNGGDSGGSVLNNSTAKGVVSGNATYSDGTVRMLYPHVHTCLQRLGLTDVVGA
ncbi:MAG TPA: S1 family peptidase [Frankiaceae bacterium]|nr:S1 family peptidase [Frankiaceae bacterium]